MNGRVYDPKLGRFLQADPFVQDPKNSQSLNRYSYVLNNPLSYTDPSGFFIAELVNFVRAVVRVYLSPQNPDAWKDLIASGVLLLNSLNSQQDAVPPGVVVAAFTNGFATATSNGANTGRNGATQNADRFPNAVIVATIGGTSSDITGEKFANGADTESFAHTIAVGLIGFGDGVFRTVTFGFGDLNEVRARLGIIGNFDRGSAAFKRSNIAGQVVGFVSGGALIGRVAVSALGRLRAALTVNVAKGVSNPVPGTVARVIPGKGQFPTIGTPGSKGVFVTAADDIAGLNAKQLSKRLTIGKSDTFTVIEFPTPSSGIASPVFRTNPGFVGGGRTAGGAREFVIPNQSVPSSAIVRIVE